MVLRLFSDQLRLSLWVNRFFILLEYEKYKETTNNILKIAERNKDTLSIAKAESYLGDYFFSLSKNDSAFYYYLKSEKKFNRKKDKSSLAEAILHKAYILLFEKDFVGSESETIKVLNIAKDLKNNSLIYECYINLGSSLSGLGNYEKALEYYQKSLVQIKNIFLQ